jgi:enoyl-CoA hydratase
MSDFITTERDGDVAVVTIRRPEKLNALDAKVLTELASELAELVAHDPPPRCAILTGEGKAFVAGADIAAMSELTNAQAKAFADQGHAIGAMLESAPFPIIAAVNGFALGGGCELALACDFIYASEKAKFGQPEVKLGVIPGFGGTQRLARRVGVGRARELVYTGDMIDAAEALRIGLVNAVVAPDQLMPKVLEVAKKIAAQGPLAVAACKRVIMSGVDADLRTANELEATAFASLFKSADQREGMRAFLDKRAAKFEGV